MAAPPTSKATTATTQGGLMRAAAFNSLGGPEVLQAVLWSRPSAAPGRVLVRVVAAGLNPIDCKIWAGEAFPFGPLTVLPKIPGSDLAGVVEDCMPGCPFKRGDRVFAVSDCFFPHIVYGAYAKYVSVAGHLALMPGHLSFEEAAAVPLVALTAWQAFCDLELPPGSRILVHGGSGGVGSLAIQLAKHVEGWHVTATCSPKNARPARDLGADEVHDYRDPELYKLYSDDSAGHGAKFDVVLDVVGGSTALDSLKVLKRRGHLVHVWTNSERWIKEAGSELRGKLASVADLARIKLMGMLFLGPKLRLVIVQPDGRQLAKVASLLGRHVIHAPRISRAFPLDRASDAHAYFEAGHGPGKVVLKVSRA